ncbi:MAG: hypothetical protein AAF206_26020 [Bacteroidota bacterium]
MLDAQQQVRPAIEVKLPGSPDVVKSSFKDHLQDKFDVKLHGYGFLTNRDVLDAQAVQFSEISEKQMDFFAEIVSASSPGETRMRVYADFGYNIPLSRAEDYEAYQNLRGILKTYIEQYKRDQLQIQTAKVEEMVEERDDLVSDKMDLMKELQATEAELERFQRKLSREQAELSDLRRRLETDR